MKASKGGSRAGICCGRCWGCGAEVYLVRCEHRPGWLLAECQRCGKFFGWEPERRVGDKEISKSRRFKRRRARL